MKTKHTILLPLAVALLGAGCAGTGPNTQVGALTGGVLGAIAGGIIGNLSLGAVDTSWVIAKVGDFDGDGKIDILWRNTASGAVALWLMNGTTLASAVDLGIVELDWNASGQRVHLLDRAAANP